MQHAACLEKKTLAFDAAEPMSSKGINMTSTVVADVGLIEWCTQMETNSYMYEPGSIGRPRDETGRACNQAPDSLVATASNLARDLQSEAPCRS